MGFVKTLFNKKASIEYLSDIINRDLQIAQKSIAFSNVELIAKCLRDIKKAYCVLDEAVQSLGHDDKMLLKIKWLDGSSIDYSTWNVLLQAELLSFGIQIF